MQAYQSLDTSSDGTKKSSKKISELLIEADKNRSSNMASNMPSAEHCTQMREMTGFSTVSSLMNMMSEFKREISFYVSRRSSLSKYVSGDSRSEAKAGWRNEDRKYNSTSCCEISRQRRQR